MIDKPPEVGDVAVLNQEEMVRGEWLACGSGVYTHAIVASVDPLVLISEEGDMRWSNEDPSRYVFLCQAADHVQRAVRKRLRSGL